jgi:hypothetical protein
MFLLLSESLSSEVLVDSFPAAVAVAVLLPVIRLGSSQLELLGRDHKQWNGLARVSGSGKCMRCCRPPSTIATAICSVDSWLIALLAVSFMSCICVSL